MKVVKVFIPGNFVDAFAYRGRLLALTLDKVFRVFNLDKIANYLDSLCPGAIPLPDLIFSKNNWLNDPAYRLYVRNPEIAQALLKSLSLLEEQKELNSSYYEISRFNFRAPEYVHPLDMTIYNGRLFLATDKAFYHLDFDTWDYGVELVPKSIPEKRHDGLSVHASAKYGTVNVSGGSDGLFYTIDEFDVLNSGAKKDLILSKEVRSSFRSDWCNYDVVNYGDSADIQLLSTNYRPHQSFGLERESTLLTDIEKNLGFWHLPRRTERSFQNLDIESIDHIFNSDRNFYIHTYDGSIYILRIAYKNKTEPTLMNVIPYKKENIDGIVKTIEIGYGFKPTKNGYKRRTATIVESFSGVIALSDDGIVNICDEPALAVRTFPNSKQYKNLLVITTKTGLLLCSVFDDTLLKASIEAANIGKNLPSVPAETEENNDENYDV